MQNGLGYIYAKCDSAGTNGERLFFRSLDAPNFYLNFGSDSATATSPWDRCVPWTDVTYGVPLLFAVTWNGGLLMSDIKFYRASIGGQLTQLANQGAGTNGTGTIKSNASSPLYLGNRTGGTRCFNGLIGPYAMFAGVLSLSELQYVANYGPDITDPRLRFFECDGKDWSQYGASLLAEVDVKRGEPPRLNWLKDWHRRFWATTPGGGAAALAGAATGQATATAALTTAISLLAAAQAQATATGALTAQIQLAAAALAQAAAGAGLTTQIQLAGQAQGAGSAAAALATAIQLAASGNAQAAASGSLTAQIQLAGAALSVAAAGGTLDASSALAGAAMSVASASGALTAQIRLDGAALAAAVAAAGLTTQIPLAGGAQAQSQAAGTLTVSIQLSGTAAGQSLGTATLTTQIPLTAAALAQAIASGSLTTQIPLFGNAAGQSFATGALMAGAVPLWMMARAQRVAVLSASEQVLAGMSRFAERTTRFSLEHQRAH